MTLYRGPYYSADGCDSSARAGTDALVSWYLGAYRARKATNLGTYVCKRLGSGWSIHAERRAADLGTSPYGGVDSTWGWALANALRLHSAELGVQLIILGRKVWSCRYPDSGWRTYTGEYHGHIHVELTPTASKSLTVAKIQNTIGGSPPPATEEAPEMIMVKAKDNPAVYVSNGVERRHIPSPAVMTALTKAGVPLVTIEKTTEMDAYAGPVRVEPAPPTPLDYRALAGAVLTELDYRVLAGAVLTELAVKDSEGGTDVS